MAVSTNPRTRKVGRSSGPIGFAPARQLPVSFVPAKSLDSEELLVRSWLLPPARPDGFEAVVQFVSKASGPVLLVAAAGGLAWLGGLIP